MYIFYNKQLTLIMRKLFFYIGSQFSVFMTLVRSLHLHLYFPESTSPKHSKDNSTSKHVLCHKLLGSMAKPDFVPPSWQTSGHIHSLPESSRAMNTTIYIGILYCYCCLITSVTVVNFILGPTHKVYHSSACTYRKNVDRS